MKTSLCLAGLFALTFSAAFGQAKRPILIGIDVLKPILSLATPTHPAYRLVEAAVRIPLTRSYLSITGGYGQLRSDTIHRNMLLNTQGYYVKIGTETPPPSGKGFVRSWNGLISTCYETGTYSFKGPTFGDYVAPIPERRRIAVGVEGIVGYQLLISQQVALRISGRVTIANLIGPKTSDIPVHFVPGIGNVAGNSFVYSAGLGVHLFYQIQPRSSTASSNDQNH